MHSEIFANSVLLVCLVAGVFSEIVTIAVPEKILSMTDADPVVLFESWFYRVVIVFSALYIGAVIMMLVSQVETLRMYGGFLVALSLCVWMLRRVLLRYRFLQIAESTLCLILLIDSARIVIDTYLK